MFRLQKVLNFLQIPTFNRYRHHLSPDLNQNMFVPFISDGEDQELYKCAYNSSYPPDTGYVHQAQNSINQEIFAIPNMSYNQIYACPYCALNLNMFVKFVSDGTFH